MIEEIAQYNTRVLSLTTYANRFIYLCCRIHVPVILLPAGIAIKRTHLRRYLLSVCCLSIRVRNGMQDKPQRQPKGADRANWWRSLTQSRHASSVCSILEAVGKKLSTSRLQMRYLALLMHRPKRVLL